MCLFSNYCMFYQLMLFTITMIHTKRLREYKQLFKNQPYRSDMSTLKKGRDPEKKSRNAKNNFGRKEVI